MLRLTSVLAIVSTSILILHTQALADLPPFTPQTIERYREAIEPTPAETAYLDIDWYSELRPAVQQAHRTQKPLLIYVMNGHPLGCT